MTGTQLICYLFIVVWGAATLLSDYEGFFSSIMDGFLSAVFTFVFVIVAVALIGGVIG